MDKICRCPPVLVGGLFKKLVVARWQACDVFGGRQCILLHGKEIKALLMDVSFVYAKSKVPINAVHPFKITRLGGIKCKACIADAWIWKLFTCLDPCAQRICQKKRITSNSGRKKPAYREFSPRLFIISEHLYKAPVHLTWGEGGKMPC